MAEEPGADPVDAEAVTPTGHEVDKLGVVGFVAMVLAVVFTATAGFLFNVEVGFGALGIGCAIVAYALGKEPKIPAVPVEALLTRADVQELVVELLTPTERGIAEIIPRRAS